MKALALFICLFGLVSARDISPQERRLQAIDEAMDPNLRKAPTIPGYDTSDDAVERVARKMCGATDECIRKYRSAKDGTVADFHGDLWLRRKIASSLKAYTVDGETDWLWVQESVWGPIRAANAAWRARRPAATTRCRTIRGKRTSTTTCTTY